MKYGWITHFEDIWRHHIQHTFRTLFFFGRCSNQKHGDLQTGRCVLRSRMRRHGLADGSGGGACQQADLVGDHLNGLGHGSQHATHEDQLGIRNMDRYGDYPLTKWEYLGFTLSFTVSVYFSYSTKMYAQSNWGGKWRSVSVCITISRRGTLWDLILAVWNLDTSGMV